MPRLRFASCFVVWKSFSCCHTSPVTPFCSYYVRMQCLSFTLLYVVTRAAMFGLLQVLLLSRPSSVVHVLSACSLFCRWHQKLRLVFVSCGVSQQRKFSFVFSGCLVPHPSFPHFFLFTSFFPFPVPFNMYRTSSLVLPTLFSSLLLSSLSLYLSICIVPHPSFPNSFLFTSSSFPFPVSFYVYHLHSSYPHEYILSPSISFLSFYHCFSTVFVFPFVISFPPFPFIFLFVVHSFLLSA